MDDEKIIAIALEVLTNADYGDDDTEIYKLATDIISSLFEDYLSRTKKGGEVT